MTCIQPIATAGCFSQQHILGLTVFDQARATVGQIRVFCKQTSKCEQIDDDHAT